MKKLFRSEVLAGLERTSSMKQESSSISSAMTGSKQKMKRNIKTIPGQHL
jgi:hypothetical protein